MALLLCRCLLQSSNSPGRKTRFCIHPHSAAPRQGFEPPAQSRRANNSNPIPILPPALAGNFARIHNTNARLLLLPTIVVATAYWRARAKLLLPNSSPTTHQRTVLYGLGAV